MFPCEMKTIYILLVAILLQMPACYVVAQSPIQVTAHRGDWRNAPENSLTGFKYAAAMGVDIVELDLKKTSDDEIVIMHDETIDRTTNGKGKPSDYTLSDIKKFRLKNGLGRPAAYDPIPTLREVMLALKGTGVKVNLDKSYPYYNEAYAILNETGTLKQAIFKSEVPYDTLKKKYPQLINNIIYMPVVNLDKPGAKKIIADYLKNMKPYAFELTFTRDTSSILTNHEFITKTGSKIWINSLWASLNGGHDDDLAVEQDNKKDSWDWIITHGAVIIQTDRPQLLLEYLRKKNLHN
jgi:glycerophosphoryl diester phosphodiesterase